MREALRGRRRVRAVLVTGGVCDRGSSGGRGGLRGHDATGDDLEPGLASWLGEVRVGRPPVYRILADELTARLHTPDHQGIAAEVDPYPYLESEEVLRGHTLLIALDEVQDPHNLGAIIRTAEGAGAAVIVPRHRAAEVTAAVVKASAGATEHTAVSRVRNLADFLGEAKEAGFWVYGAAAGAESSYTAQDYRYPTCFVVGSEGEGLGRRVASLCDVLVRLPLAGKVESLNVGVSAGILLYEAVRQRGAAGPLEAEPPEAPGTVAIDPAAPECPAGGEPPGAAFPDEGG